MFLKPTSFFLTLFLFFLYGCSNSSSEASGSTTDPKVDAAYKSVMAVHDEVMPEMGTIHRLRKQLKENIATDSLDENTLAAMTQMIETLDAADEGMMSWMADFKMPKAETIEAQLDYLQSEQAKIDQVSKDMFSAIESAKEMLGDE